MIVAGLGLRSGCAAGAILDLLQAAHERCGRQADLVAVPAFRYREAGLQAALARLGLTLCAVTPDELAAAQPRCLTRSARAQAALGVASVAEGCALAAAGPYSRLIVPRLTGTHATCAMAQGEDA
ncbi:MULTISPECIES: cobalamin biosynthesis protein [Komagataeibacter]|uniref:Cobalamin biosynthesis protein n=2 Tax=Komagataeibacter TaxID=1434011 RepID=A0A318R023_9PROT|nr:MULTISPECIES: cobalamin biosynthesis protein [Komagataeibacter]GBR34827.1 cobalamin biosynthesis protein [Komagataeibacter oboediens DSM 11826]MBL7232927.1 cobalamin biosynthesis protein [Komagataeibacter oboediens]MBT0674251.1 cobalamin biosynthesis protein [Komagataeibacter oboediens]MBT0679412.1 cobalamin biosynthesis protein [Komagataeibacter oboediens]MBV0889426.1 cobalamin biosynthesis protein [Komagataeibacter oboediens]